MGRHFVSVDEHAARRPILRAGMVLLVCGVAWSSTSASVAPDPTASDDASGRALRIGQLLDEADYDDAERLAREHVRECEDAQEGDTLDLAKALDLLAEALWRGNRANDPEAEEAARRALRIKEELLGHEHLEVAYSLNNYANLLGEAGDYERAKPLYFQALEIREKALGHRHRDVAVSQYNLAILLWELAEYDDAVRLCQAALVTWETTLGPGAPHVALARNLLGDLLLDAGRFGEARACYETAIADQERALGPEHPDVAQTLNNLGWLLYVTGDFSRARSSYVRALEIREKALHPDHADVAKVLQNLATLLGDMGDFDGAAEACGRAVAIRERTEDPGAPDLAQAWSDYAVLLAARGDPDRAAAYFERALATMEAAVGPEHPDVAHVLGGYGYFHSQQGDHDRARELFVRAAAIYTKVRGPRHPDTAGVLQDLAFLELSSGDRERARKLFQRSLDTFESFFGSAHPEVARCLEGLATERALAGDAASALAFAQRAEAVGREHLRLTVRVLPEIEALQYAAVRPSGVDVALGIATHGGDAAAVRSAWDEVIRSRGLLLDEMALRRRTLTRVRESETATLERRHRDALRRMADLVLTGPDEETDEEFRRVVDEARAEKIEAERALAERSAAFRSSEEHSRIGWEEVRHSLGPKEALVAYVLYRDRKDGGEIPTYLAFVANGRETDPRVIPLGSAAAIDSLVSEWQEEMDRGVTGIRTAGALDSYRTVARRLSARIWDPLREAFLGCNSIVVVPDGLLGFVSIAALPMGETEYEIDRDAVVRYAAAERDLVAPASGNPGSGLLALGGAWYDAELPAQTSPAVLATVLRGRRSGCADFESLSFPFLPESEKEVIEIAALWRDLADRAEPPVAIARSPGPVRLLTGSEATETEFEKQAGGRRVLHLATHGFFLGRECPGASGGPAASHDREGLRQVVGESPLLASGLAFSGANRRGKARSGSEDGILTAEEISALDLSGVQWAVLSACETGLGVFRRGGGVYGLQRAFRVAGVGTLLMSLWSVEDASAREWMQTFYRSCLLDAATPSEGADRASREILARRRSRGASTHPAGWACFVAVGVR